MIVTRLKLLQIASLSLVCGAFFVMSACRAGAQSPGHCTLTVKVTGIRNTTGDILISLRKGADTVIGSRKAEIDPKTMIAKAVFDKVPEGVYEVSVIHDENKNGKLDFNEMGMPLEGYGHSNNPERKMGPPSFDEYKFELKQPGSSLEINLIYWQ